MSSREYNKLKQKHTNFTWSTPVGYDFKEVDSEIENYKKTISDINELLNKKDSMIQVLKNENNRLIDEVTNSRIALEDMLVPNMSEDQSLEILNDFSGGQFEISEEEIDDNIKEEPVVEKPKPKNNKNRFNVIQ